MPSKSAPCPCANCNGDIRAPATIRKHLAREAERNAQAASTGATYVLENQFRWRPETGSSSNDNEMGIDRQSTESLGSSESVYRSPKRRRLSIENMRQSSMAETSEKDVNSATTTTVCYLYILHT